MKNSACSSENSNWMRLHCKCRLKLMCSSFPWVNARFPPRTEKWDFLLYRVHACFSLFFVGKAVRRILFRLPKKTVQKCLTLEGNKETKTRRLSALDWRHFPSHLLTEHSVEDIHSPIWLISLVLTVFLIPRWGEQGDDQGPQHGLVSAPKRFN